MPSMYKAFDASQRGRLAMGKAYLTEEREEILGDTFELGPWMFLGIKSLVGLKL